MFAARTCVRNASVARPIAGLPSQRRSLITTIQTSLLNPHTPLAEQLAATGVWYYGRNLKANGTTKKVKGDKSRVNIVDEKLCDDIIGYIRPSLDRHVGCDLLDLYPGAGLWSRKLHDVVQPRSHILLEPDSTLYAPFLEPLTSRPNVTLLAKSGIVWGELNEVLTPKYLPHQIERNPRTGTPERNDTLLVTANLSFFPKKKYRGFANVTSLLLYQFINSIRSGTLFQKYGLVRMLIWTGDEEKHGLVPRNIQRRKRLAVDAELSTDYVAEIAGTDHGDGQDPRFKRDHNIDLESLRDTLRRMEANGIETPPGRETVLMKELNALPKPKQDTIRAGSVPATFNRAYRAELVQLEADSAAGNFLPAEERMKKRRLTDLRYKVSWEARRHKMIQELLSDKSITPAEWEEHIKALDKYLRIDFLLQRDNLHIFRQDPPVLTWDRRSVEPLVVKAEEFFPTVPSTLIDIQPKATHDLLRRIGPGTSRSGDIFGVILSPLMRHSLDPLSKVLESIYPGAREGVLPNCKTLNLGDGMPPGYPEWNARSLNEAQYVDILENWMRWPFRPTFPELIARESEDSDLLGDDEPASVQMGDF